MICTDSPIYKYTMTIFNTVTSCPRSTIHQGDVPVLFVCVQLPEGYNGFLFPSTAWPENPRSEEVELWFVVLLRATFLSAKINKYDPSFVSSLSPSYLPSLYHHHQHYHHYTIAISIITIILTITILSSSALPPLYYSHKHYHHHTYHHYTIIIISITTTILLP